MWRKVSIAINGLVVIVIAVLMLQFGTSDENSARVRNSLIARIGQSGDFTWSPDHVPDSFVSEHEAPPERLAAITKKLLPDPGGQTLADLDKAEILARHLAGNRQQLSPIQSSTLDAYRQIVENGDGYCADYSQVFTALALAGGLSVREWGLSWSGFGFGHTFNEIFDSDLGKWVFIDSFNSIYVTDADTGIPLSAREFQKRLRGWPDAANVKVIPLFDDKFYFKSQADALEYYARGADQFFMFWGNNVFSYDDNPWMKVLSRLPRAVEVMGAILLGVHPSIRVVKTQTNAGEIDLLFRTRRTLLIYFGLCFAGMVLLILQIWLYLRARHNLRV